MIQLWEMILEPPLYHMDATAPGLTPSTLCTPPTRFLQSLHPHLHLCILMLHPNPTFLQS